MTNIEGILIFIGIAIAVLILASTIVEGLKRRGKGVKRIGFIEDRIASWWVILFVFVLALVSGKLGMVILFAICAFTTLREFLSILEIKPSDHWALLAIVFVVLPLQFFFVGKNMVEMFMVFIPVYAFLLIPIASIFRATQSERFLVSIAQYQWAMMLCIYAMSHLPAIMFLEIDGFNGHNILLLVYVIFITEMARIFQHILSTQIKSRKIAPRISKTHSLIGLFGGAAVASLFGMCLSFLTPFGMLGAFLLSLATTLMGLCGAFVLTAIKRDRGVRTFDQAITGHGGFLDGFAALLYAAPIYYHLIRVFW